MSQPFQRLKAKLEELFQLDRPDLDFGVYRIMHARSAEISSFLEKDLLPQVREAFAQYRSADRTEIQKDLQQALEQAESLGADPETLPKVKALRERLTDAVDVGGLEVEVYDHLYNFFRRYYSDGDFLSHRVYRAGVYAIPYEGEEVKLHWANADQYYIKSDEYLRDYTFLLRPDDPADKMRVHFKLVDAAEGEHGTVKEAEGKNRVFVLAPDDFVAEDAGSSVSELTVRFEYRPATPTAWGAAQAAGAAKPPTQKDLNPINEGRILSALNGPLIRWADALGPHISGHLAKYAARNTFDYFIHKDLGGFLRRELDFYIKNEVMHLDDVESESVPRVEQYLSKIKVIRRIAAKIIAFLAQLEDFQKRLWLKKKFVTETFWCIRLGCIPEEFYPAIAASDRQRDEWVTLHSIDQIKGDLTTPGYRAPLTPEFLVANPTLMVDTRHFDPALIDRLVEAMGDLNGRTDGVIFHSENFQALSLMRAQFRQQVKCIYIDPPYNTDASAIVYKNDYKHSSWMSLVENRVANATPLLRQEGILCVAIDDEEVSVARLVLGGILPKLIGIAVVRSNPQSRKTRGKFSPVHEYALFFGMGPDAAPGSLEITEKRLARYPKEDEKGRFSWMNFIRTGNNDRREDRPKLYYPIFVSQDDSIRVPAMSWSRSAGENGEYVLLESPRNGESLVLPVDTLGDETIEKNWHRGPDRVSNEPEEFRVRRDPNGRISIDFKTRLDENSAPTTWWDVKEYASANYGAAELKSLFGNKPFDFPKAVCLVMDSLRAANAGAQAVVLDFFAGSGTTGHAIINLNREDGGGRKFLLVEAGAHLESVILPRLKKVTFSPEWTEAKPARVATAEEAERSPRIMKVIRLESYEDALNNLDLRRNDAQQSLLDVPEAAGADGLREQYLLKYMLDVEARGSQSLLNVTGFLDPRAYRLKVKRPGSDETRDVNVDLLETFNYLVGLTVDHMAAPQTFDAAFTRDDDPDLPEDAPRRLLLDGRLKEDPNGVWWFRSVTGTTPEGQKALVIWRNRPGGESPEGVEQDNLVLDAWFQKQRYSSKDSEFDVIWVNGDNNLENLKVTDDNETARWKVRLIEEDFHRLMFEMDGD